MAVRLPLGSAFAGALKCPIGAQVRYGEQNDRPHHHCRHGAHAHGQLPGCAVGREGNRSRGDGDPCG